METKLIWITLDAEELIVHMARVSNPKSQEEGKNSGQLINYLIRNKHWSPFEMASACFEIGTTRDIARQILRHRSFSFQEFSQRYANTDNLPPVQFKQARLQDTKNRQSSIFTEDKELITWWHEVQKTIIEESIAVYNEALTKGIAKEQARAVLPEGLTPTRLYMSGTIRSWIHYCELRTDISTQLEHRQIAAEIQNTLQYFLPNIFNKGK